MALIPQDIIDTIIETVDSRALKKCALVSSSFLLPCRKRLFSRLYLRSEEDCQRLQQFLIENPLILPSVKAIDLVLGCRGFWADKLRLNGTPLIVLLQLPFRCLEHFSVNMVTTVCWNEFSSELKDALTTIIHSSLKTLDLNSVLNVPSMLLQGIHLTGLRLNSVTILDSEQLKLTPQLSEGVVTTMSNQDVWTIDLCNQVRGPTEPIFLPSMCRLRTLTIHCDPCSAIISDFHILSFMIRSLRLSLTSPPTLEHLKLGITFLACDNEFDLDAFYDDLRHADFWRHLDSIVTHPTGSRLQRVDIDIEYAFREDIDVCEPDETEVEEPILDALPLLREKGILFVRAALNV